VPEKDLLVANSILIGAVNTDRSNTEPTLISLNSHAVTTALLVVVTAVGEPGISDKLVVTTNRLINSVLLYIDENPS